MHAPYDLFGVEYVDLVSLYLMHAPYDLFGVEYVDLVLNGIPCNFVHNMFVICFFFPEVLLKKWRLCAFCIFSSEVLLKKWHLCAFCRSAFLDRNEFRGCLLSLGIDIPQVLVPIYGFLLPLVWPFPLKKG